MNRLALVLALGSSSAALAGGMVLPVRGVRDVERAGAYIAGSEDADSLWLNPAGLAHLTGGTSILIDGSYVNQAVDYTRIDSGGTKQPMVSNQYPGITIPTAAIAYSLNDKLVIAGGFTAPYAGLHRYDVDGTQRYASISLAESTFVMLSVGAAYKVNDKLRVGVTLTDTISLLKSRVILSGCPGQTVCAPEDPEFDADTKIEQLDAFAPGISAGVQYDLAPRVTLGAMAQTPGSVDGTGTLTTRLPSSGLYEGAVVKGNSVSLAFNLPAIARGGVEVRPTDRLRVEAALDIELWGNHDQMTITPHDVEIDDVPGIGTYQVGRTVIPRHYRTSYAPSVGGEYKITDKMSVGAGYSYETAAAPPAYVSVLTVDSAKHIIGLGGSVDALGWQFGAAFGFVKLTNVNLGLSEAKVPQLTPIRDQPSDVIVNAGTYHSHYILAGLRASKRF